MGVGTVPRAHRVDGAGEEGFLREDPGILGKEAEDQPGHELVHLMAARGGAPVGVVPQQFDIKPVQTAGRLDVKGVLADRPNGGDTRQRQEKAEMVGEVIGLLQSPAKNVLGALQSGGQNLAGILKTLSEKEAA